MVMMEEEEGEEEEGEEEEEEEEEHQQLEVVEDVEEVEQEACGGGQRVPQPSRDHQNIRSPRAGKGGRLAGRAAAARRNRFPGFARTALVWQGLNGIAGPERNNTRTWERGEGRARE
ncbi:hypothetical protein B2J93_1604 [Marssonina coronariae]|uniref:Uncharacterized protein n=1 Tax=Diplocarpon coronariae TaxID=2795749 RepID=A0A218YVB6_9HELO|nr:hypothetical protein B2J93_1604 [Marssonina coronariae]